MHYRINFSETERKRYAWRQRGKHSLLLFPLILAISLFGWLYQKESEFELIQSISQYTTGIEKTHDQLEQILAPLPHMAPLVNIPRNHAATIKEIVEKTSQSRRFQLQPRRFTIDPDGKWQLDMFHIMPAGLPSYAAEADLAHSNIIEQLPGIAYSANWPARELPGGGMQLHITLSSHMQVAQPPDFQIPSALTVAWQQVEEHRKAISEMVRPSTKNQFGILKNIFSRSNKPTTGEVKFLDSIRNTLSDIQLQDNADASLREELRALMTRIDQGIDNPDTLIRDILALLEKHDLQNLHQGQELANLRKEWHDYTKRRFCSRQSLFKTLCERRDTLRELHDHIPPQPKITATMQQFAALQNLPQGWFSYNDHLKEQRPKELLQFLLTRYEVSHKLQYSFQSQSERGATRLIPSANPLYRAISWNISMQGGAEGNTVSIEYQDLIRFLEALENAQGLFLPRAITLSFQINRPGVLDVVQIQGILPLFDMNAVEKNFHLQTNTVAQTGGQHGF